MNALQKVAWIELIVAIVASVVVLGAIPLLGERSTDLYGLLAIVAVIYPFLMRPKGGEIVKDERDNEIAKRAEYWGCLLYTSPSPRDATLSRMPSSA